MKSYFNGVLFKGCVFMALVVFPVTTLVAQNGAPPPPPPTHGSNSNHTPASGGAPLGSGTLLLLALGAVYGGYKYISTNHENQQEER